jgi:hypothetical protein
MGSKAYGQPSSADVRRSFTIGPLVIHEAPAGAESVIGKSLLDAGVLDVAGAYVCNIDTYDWSAVEVSLQPSDVTGSFAPALERMWWNKQAVRDTEAGANFADDTLQTLALSDLNGTNRVRVKFTIPALGSIEFANTVPATPTSLAEFNGT